MKKVLICLIVILMFILCIVQAVAEENTETVDVSAPGAILIDEATGTVLMQKEADTHFDLAGLTKIMSVYLACENLKDTDNITLSSEVSASYDHSTSVIWVMEGETLQVLDAEYASLIQNANDTTAMLADKVSKSEDAFIEKMNETSREFEMNNTNFQNIFGLNNENNYSCARDIATLVRKAVKNETFAKIFGASSWTIEATNLQSNARVLAQGCEFLRSGNYYNEDVDGCKVGYTAEGGYALATKATRNGTSFIAVVLGEETEGKCYEDVNALLNYGFSNYHTVEITPQDIGTKVVEVKENNKRISTITFSIENSFSALLPIGVKKEDITTEILVKNETSPVIEDISAEVQFILNGEIVSTSEMKKDVENIKQDRNAVSSKQGTTRQYFDYFCIGLLALFAVIQIAFLLEPPK